MTSHSDSKQTRRQRFWRLSPFPSDAYTDAVARGTTFTPSPLGGKLEASSAEKLAKVCSGDCLVVGMVTAPDDQFQRSIEILALGLVQSDSLPDGSRAVQWQKSGLRIDDAPAGAISNWDNHAVFEFPKDIPEKRHILAEFNRLFPTAGE